MHENIVHELIKEYKTSTYQLTYYLMAISTACIGFTIHFIVNHSDKEFLFILFIAVLCWALSFFNGYKRIDRLIDFVRGNIIGLQTLDEMNVKGGKELLEDILRSPNDKQEKNYKWQIRFLGLGLFCFVSWLILDIYIF